MALAAGPAAQSALAWMPLDPLILAPASSRATSQPPNVLLITLDTLRADFLGAYGRASIQTPALDAFAAQGARFAANIVQQPQTNASHAAVLTGMYPASNGVRVQMVDKVPANLQTLATVFGGAGYA
ncbi:MAG: sulfatase-like hydrolase/transferase, partial [Chloroflexi bacterium]|nr:sulfatase-like hydrolase/transferase [Chloroflexota bacterium]